MASSEGLPDRLRRAGTSPPQREEGSSQGSRALMGEVDL